MGGLSSFPEELLLESRAFELCHCQQAARQKGCGRIPKDEVPRGKRQSETVDKECPTYLRSNIATLGL